MEAITISEIFIFIISSNHSIVSEVHVRKIYLRLTADLVWMLSSHCALPPFDPPFLWKNDLSLEMDECLAE